MNTSRIFITGQKSVEIDNSEISMMKKAQLRSPQIYVRSLFMVWGLIVSVLSQLLKTTTFAALGFAFYLVVFESAEAASIFASFQKMSLVETVASIKSFLGFCLAISGVFLIVVGIYNPSRFGFKNVFQEDLFARIAEKLKVKPYQIESMTTDL